jgi:hypothetical protein
LIERRVRQIPVATERRKPGRPAKPESERSRYRVRPIRLLIELDDEMWVLAKRCGLTRNAFIVQSVKRLVAIHTAALASRADTDPAPNSLYSRNPIDCVSATE